MLVQATAILTLGLAGCAAGEEKGLSLPLQATEGVNMVVKDFVELCSQAMVDPAVAIKSAEARGWKVDAGMAVTTAAIRETGMQKIHSDEVPPETLLVVETSYADMTSITCSMTHLPNHGASDVDPAEIGRTSGVQGSFALTPETFDPPTFRGAWSFIGPQGQPVAIDAVNYPARLMYLKMATQHRVARQPQSLSKS